MLSIITEIKSYILPQSMLEQVVKKLSVIGWR